MTEHSTIRLERSSPQVAKITFTNPPANLIVAETVLRLAEIVTELQKDPDIQVVVFDSGVPDFFSTTSTSPPRTSPPRTTTTRRRCGPTSC